MSVSRLRLTGLDCADCAAKLASRLGGMDGVGEVDLNFGAGILTISHSIPVSEVIRMINGSGYGAEPVEAVSRPAHAPEGFKAGRRLLLTVLCGVFLGAGFIFSLTELPAAYSIGLYLLAIISGGLYTAISGWRAIKSLSPDMNFLMTVAVIGAAAIGQWSEGATVVFLFSLGNLLQSYTMEKTRRSIRELMDLSPREALVRRGGHEMRLPVAEVIVDDVLIVRPGERIAMDGRVISGLSAVNQAPITGESMPVEKGPGATVFAGTINGEGALEVRVTRLAQDTTLARVINLVEEAQAQKAPSQQFIDVFARYYTPAVIGAAVLVAVMPALIWGLPFVPWFTRALILLVIACPCALVISTPVSIVAAIGSAARRGVLIKGGAHLEAAGSLKVVAFDKTGTLTTGRPEVTDVLPLLAVPGPKGDENFAPYPPSPDGCNAAQSRLLAIAAAVESRSEHPLGRAIRLRAATAGLAIQPGRDYRSLAGKGASAVIDGQTYYIGNTLLFEELGVSAAAAAGWMEQLPADGKTAVLVGTATEMLGVIAVADRVRPGTRAVIDSLRRSGIQRILMLTGDHAATARAVAGQLGVDGFRAGMLPRDKLDAVRELKEQYGKVAMVGDGVNDAPALAAATVGIAVGGAGSDTALETADVVLLAGDLARLPYAMHLSRRALRIIKENIWFAILIKALFIVLTFAGLANLWMAVFADTGAALLVIANGMRLMRVGEAY
ncbi:hypothetical protein A6M21_08480 [Desulfotomaculum copahuensis]|uniref:Cd(2+)-exporting ATPase n=2 Tax=Desulfotomaculum copahuensis TaxID=1838280 RepID=A0A1B7LFK8_9FIRM|nr:hypothetical protein A6M21_08480 [Desulfotomaculum copahuensis]